MLLFSGKDDTLLGLLGIAFSLLSKSTSVVGFGLRPCEFRDEVTPTTHIFQMSSNGGSTFHSQTSCAFGCLGNGTSNFGKARGFGEGKRRLRLWWRWRFL